MTTEPKPVWENDFYTKLVDQNGKLFSNQIGKFIVISIRGYNYIIIMYNHNSKEILAEALKRRVATDQLATTTKLYTY